MINKESIISIFNDKPTLLEWLKKVEAALKGASASSFKVNKTGDATLTFSIVFDDGSEIESDPLTLQQGESVQSAFIQNGHLILTLTNGDELDAGALFNGDVNINGNFTANSIIENMNGYRFNKTRNTANRTLTYAYAGVVKNGNKITFAVAVDIETLAAIDEGAFISLGNFTIPAAIGEKLKPYTLGAYNDVLHTARISIKRNDSLASEVKNALLIVQKLASSVIEIAIVTEGVLTSSYHYVARVEVTFLLSDSLV